MDQTTKPSRKRDTLCELYPVLFAPPELIPNPHAHVEGERPMMRNPEAERFNADPDRWARRNVDAERAKSERFDRAARVGALHMDGDEDTVRGFALGCLLTRSGVSLPARTRGTR